MLVLAPEYQTVVVVIPVHDRAELLAETIRAVASQMHQALEVVLVDDGSSDESEAVARSVGLPLRWLRQVHQRGVSHARNAGLAGTTAPCVCFLDEDDVWHPEHLRRQLACFARRAACGSVVSPYQHWQSGINGYASVASLWPADTGDTIDPAFSGWVDYQFMLVRWAMTSATVPCCGELQAQGAFDKTLPYSEDWGRWLRLSREVELAKLPGPPVLYRQHTVQGSRKARGVNVRSQLQQGDASLGTRLLRRSWRRPPLSPRLLARAVADSLGWPPVASSGSDTLAAAS